MYKELVGPAAEWLDTAWPADLYGSKWWEVLDFERLAMPDGCRCVCGQLGAEIARQEGWEVETEFPVILGKNREGEKVEHTGYGLMVTLSLDSSVMELADEKLVRIVQDRLGGEMPEEIKPAFSASTRASAWRVEVNRRRHGDL